MSKFLSLLRNSTSLAQIHQIHARIIIHGLPLHNHLLTKLVELDFIDYAHFVFDQIPSPTDFSWNSLIKGYTHNGSPHTSLLIYQEMLRKGVKPSNFTYPFVIKACSVRGSVIEGEEIHALVFKLGFGCDSFVSNSLIDMYCKCFRMACACNVFDEMLERDEVSWNSIISGFVKYGEVEKAREMFDEMLIGKNVFTWTSMINGYGKNGNLVEMMGLFRKMLLSIDEDVKPNAATMVCLLSACSSLGNYEIGKWVSVFIDVNGICSNHILSNALMDMYSKCGELSKARKLFDASSFKNLAAWNCIITGYVQHGLLEEALQLFYTMKARSVKLDEITMVNVLSACAGLGALKLGRDVHIYLGRNGLYMNVILATALIDMYSKCGQINDACLVFVKMRRKDVGLWNAMILGLAYHGNGLDALKMFTQMEISGIKPNEVTFTGILSACNHSGLVDEGRSHFSNMLEKHRLRPTIAHYACMVDLLGRAGHLAMAYELVQTMDDAPDSIIWGVLLNACRIYRNLKITDTVSNIVTSVQEPDLGLCVLLSNIYASVGRWKDVVRLRRLAKDRRLKKPSGASWIELDNGVHRFVVEDTSHEKYGEINEIYQKLVNRLKLECYLPNYDYGLGSTDKSMNA